MAQMRKPFQGVLQIVRFNWPLYALAALIPVLYMFIADSLSSEMSVVLGVVSIGILATTVLSLLVSYWIYDLSELYTLQWLPEKGWSRTPGVINVHAGFDETSEIIHLKFPTEPLSVIDFYDPTRHTEKSIERARCANPPYPGTICCTTSSLPFANESLGKGLLLFAAHEIRNNEERCVFFREINRIIATDGTLVVTEHLRDGANFIAYTIGFFHFLSRKTWLQTFKSSGWRIEQELKITPFVTTFILKKHGSSS